MNDYPIGSFLVWRPPTNMQIRCRRFTKDYKTGVRLIAEEITPSPTPYLVLDGQQRLQSLYMGFLGSYDREYLYFKVDSNPQNEENDLRYQFQFMMPEQAQEDPHWVKLIDIVNLRIEQVPEFVSEQFSSDTDDVKKIVLRNLSKFIRVFNIDEKIHILDVEEDLPYEDVLEVFVRVNSGGVVLTKSDLVFSTVVLNIPDMEREFIEIVDELNGGGEYEFDLDFIIKTSFVLFDKGAKYDVNKLKDKQYLDRLEADFNALKSALLSTIQFLKSDAKILSKRFLKSDLALIPIADFIYRQPHQQIPDGQAWKLRQYLYMSFFMRFYSHGPDGKLDALHNIITKHANPNIFPIEDISKYLERRTGISFRFLNTMLYDLDLVLNITQGGVTDIPQKRGWSLEKDHIFPQSVLKEKNISDELINNVGNLRLINKTRNILKSDSLPEEGIEFFGSNVPDLKELFLKARENLTEENYKNFVQYREKLIFNEVNKFLSMPRNDGTGDAPVPV
jgi:hypothetical protein